MNLWVLKIGTSLLRGNKLLSTASVIESFASCIADSKSRGDQIVLVTSGAVGLGCRRLGLEKRPKDMVSLQAVAAIGQGHLMALYESAMSKYHYKVAQVLLTRADLGSKNSFRNASKTLHQLLDWGVLPIVNENDTLSAEELRYGDNDTLSALVATAVDADQLILLTDVDRLYSSNPKIDSKAKPITEIHHPNELKTLEASQSSISEWGTGGIQTKLAAARIATASGIKVQLADGRDPKMLGALLKGSRGGTIFHPHPQPLASRKSWLAHAIVPVGSVLIDSGACIALQKKGASLLQVGIQNVEGNFEANQPVKILNKKGEELARGISSLSSKEIQNSLLNPPNLRCSPVVIHRDVLVLTANSLD